MSQGAKPKNRPLIKDLALPPPLKSVKNIQIIHEINDLDLQAEQAAQAVALDDANIPSMPRVNSIVTCPKSRRVVQEVDRHENEYENNRFIIDSSSDELHTIATKAPNKHIRRRSISLDMIQHEKVNAWLENRKLMDGMNKYLTENTKSTKPATLTNPSDSIV